MNGGRQSLPQPNLFFKSHMYRHMNFTLYLLLLVFILIFVMMGIKIQLVRKTKIEGTEGRGGGLIIPAAGPVDMLLQPKQLLMDGYRFQNAMFPPDPVNYRTSSYCDPLDRQRVGVFKEKAYVDQLGGDGSTSQATLAQLFSRGEQDKYLLADPNMPIDEMENPFGHWISCRNAHWEQMINDPNKVFSWGDVINRYQGQITIESGGDNISTIDTQTQLSPWDGTKIRDLEGMFCRHILRPSLTQ